MLPIKKFISTTLFLSILLFSKVEANTSDNIYTIKEGDTIYEIAQKHKIKVSEIQNLNPELSDIDFIKEGDKIKLPNNVIIKKTIEEEILDLVNIERKKENLKPLKMTADLEKLAKIKSKDMMSNNYFDHKSPTHGTPFKMLQTYKIKYSKAGENIAQGYTTAKEVMDAWLASEGHRKNILYSEFTEVGIGFVKSDKTSYFTQIFITP